MPRGLVTERRAATPQYDLALEVDILVFDPDTDASQDKKLLNFGSSCFKRVAMTEPISDKPT